MSGVTQSDVESVVFFSRPLKDFDLTRLVHHLRVEAARKGQQFTVVRHIRGKFLDFAGSGMRGSVVLSQRPLSAPIWEAYLDTRQGTAGQALKSDLTKHSSHMHITLEHVADSSTTTELATRSILRSALGCCLEGAPSAVWYAPEATLLNTPETADLLGSALDVSRGVSRAFTPKTSKATTAAPSVAPKRMAVARAGAVHTPPRQRPGQVRGLPHRKSAQSKLEQWLKSGVWFPSPASLGRVAAGVIFGFLISGWVQSTIAPNEAIANTSPQPIVGSVVQDEAE